MSTPAVTPEFAQAYCAMMLEGFANEVETTKKVLSAIPDGKRDYRPDPTPALPGNWPGIWPTPTSSSSTASRT